MHFFADYGLFLLKTLTWVLAILFLVISIMAIASKNKTREKLRIKKLNKKLRDNANIIKQEVLSKHDYKKELKREKKAEKAKEKELKRRVFVIKFHGDIKASQVSNLRKEVTAVLAIAKPNDEVIVLLESPGGMVHGYGLGASQLVRIRSRNIPLTVIIDKVAASGGYLMASVANKILAAPFAIIGSIGVIAQIPNFHRWLKNHDIDFEQITAGEFKRTLTLFGENSNKARQKFQEEIENIHDIFKSFISEYRHQIDINKVATGEHWLATDAIKLNLVDELQTSDDYLIQASEYADVYEVHYESKKGIADKFTLILQKLHYRFLMNIWQTQKIDQTLQ